MLLWNNYALLSRNRICREYAHFLSPFLLRFDSDKWDLTQTWLRYLSQKMAGKASAGDTIARHYQQNICHPIARQCHDAQLQKHSECCSGSFGLKLPYDPTCVFRINIPHKLVSKSPPDWHIRLDWLSREDDWAENVVIYTLFWVWSFQGRLRRFYRKHWHDNFGHYSVGGGLESQNDFSSLKWRGWVGSPTWKSPQKPIFIGPRYTWGPIYGSGCLWVLHSLWLT